MGYVGADRCVGPDTVPLRDPFTGGHIGPPLREAGSVPEPTGIGAETDLANGAGRSPPPTGGGAGRRVQDGGVRATEATLAVHSSGPMYLRHGFRRPNFVPKFEASVMGIGPCGDRGRAAEVVGPYGRSTEAPATGRCGHRPLRKAQSTTQASRRAAKRPRLRPRGMGGNRRKDHLKMGTAAATAGAALSEAESAERAAGQIQSLPDDLRVQHGAEGPEV